MNFEPSDIETTPATRKPGHYDFDVAILGAGTAGMSAFREASNHAGRIALIDGGPLGTTCARVGCMPSKLLIAAAEAAHGPRNSGLFGIDSPPPQIDGKRVMARVRSERDRFVGFVREAVESFEGVTLFSEYARFEDDNSLRLSSGRIITARAIVIATGSRPAVPQALFAAGERLIVNDDIFDWDDLPSSVAVFGAGVIGLELGQALHRLGVRAPVRPRQSHRSAHDPEVRDYAVAQGGFSYMARRHAYFAVGESRRSLERGRRGPRRRIRPCPRRHRKGSQHRPDRHREDVAANQQPGHARL